MAFCKNCGAELKEGAKFCESCGTPVEEAAKAAATEEKKTESFQEKVSNLNNTPDTTADYDAKDIEDNKLMGILAYIGILVLIPIFAAKESKFARFHANQGLILLVIEVASFIIGFIPFIGTLINWIIGIAVLVLAILGIVNVANGKVKELPIVGKYKILK